jgi:hypothetical protein
MVLRSLLVPFAVLCFACSGKSGLSAKPDASPPDAATDLASPAERPPDAAHATDLPVAADLSPDASGANDAPAETAPAPDAPADLPSGVDLAPDKGVTPDFGQDGAGSTDLPAETPANRDVAVETRTDSGYADACQAVANSTFLSTEPHECGLTPTGPASCQWRISFTDNGATRQLSWQLSDYSLGLVYRCDGFSLTAQSASGTGETFSGTYDPVTGILDWDGFDYTKVIR